MSGNQSLFSYWLSFVSDKRKAEAEKILSKYPDRIPVRSSSSSSSSSSSCSSSSSSSSSRPRVNPHGGRVVVLLPPGGRGHPLVAYSDYNTPPPLLVPLLRTTSKK